MALKTYAELDINITDVNSTTFVPALNGRQGDNNREVFLWLKNGKQGYDLTGKTVTLYVKDAAGVVKTASTMNDQTGLSTGHFSLLIPSAVYQAPGAVQDSYIQIKQNDTVITSIPVAFNVVENTMLVTQTQSETYLNDVQKLADEANTRLAATTSNLAAVENAVQALQVTISNLNEQYNSDLFAQKAKDNDFKGNNTFDGATNLNGTATVNNGLSIAKGGLFVNDSSSFANDVKMAGKLTTQGGHNADSIEVTGVAQFDGTTNLNGDTVSKKLDANGSLYAHQNFQVFGDSIVQKIDVMGPLLAHQNTVTNGFSMSKTTAQADVWDNGLNGHLVRIGNTVTVRINGSILAEHASFSQLEWAIPAGFRPAFEADILASVGYSKGLIRVFPDGTAGNIDQAFHSGLNNGGDNVAFGFGSWATTDDFPS